MAYRSLSFASELGRSRSASSTPNGQIHSGFTALAEADARYPGYLG